MDQSESVESEKPNINQPPEAPRRISRRRFLKIGAGVVVGAAATAVAAPEVLKLIKGGEDSKDEVPTYEELVASVKGVYINSGREIPEDVAKRLAFCDEKNLPANVRDPVRTVTYSCAEVGIAVRDLYRENKNESLKEVLHKIEIYTNGKIDQYVDEGKYPDPAAIDGLKNQFKKDFFTP